MLLQQHSFKSLGILRWELDIAQHDLFHHDAILRQLLCDPLFCQPAEFIAFAREDLFHRVVWRHIAKYSSNQWTNNLLVDWLGNIVMNVIEATRIDAITDADCHPDIQPLA